MKWTRAAETAPRDIDERAECARSLGPILFPMSDDATVPRAFARIHARDRAVADHGMLLAVAPSMAERSLEERVSTIEAQLAGKTLQDHFREQAELMDRRFAAQAEQIEAIKADLAVIKDAVRLILTRLT